MPQFLETFRHYRPLLDTLDILIVAVIVYNVLTLIKGTRAVRMLVGLLTLVLVSVVSRYLELSILDWTLTTFFRVFLIAVIILFQPELRRGLAQIGKSPFRIVGERYEDKRVIHEISKAVGTLSSRLIGALIAIQRETDLTGFVEGGISIGGDASRELLVSTFLPYSPMHDGAVIVRRGKVVKAGCFLPLSVSAKITKEMGTRHRAALGLAEETDALVVVVSEETGNISLAMDGSLVRVSDVASLTQILENRLVAAKSRRREVPEAEGADENPG